MTSCTECSGNYLNCDSTYTNGCEVNKKTDNNNCGSCGNKCVGGQSCTNGTCQCPSGMIFCNNKCIDPQTSTTNCGAKGECNNNTQTNANYKGASCEYACVNGICRSQCENDQILCSNKCIDPASSTSNCGAKGACNNNTSSSSDFQGINCYADSNVELAFCNANSCYIASCKNGYKVKDNASCVQCLVNTDCPEGKSCQTDNTCN